MITEHPDSWFIRDMAEYARKDQGSGFPITSESLFAMQDDRRSAPAIDVHYFYADLWAARRISQTSARAFHLDVGSRVDGLVAHLLVDGRRVTHVDIRAPHVDVAGFNFIPDDARTLTSFDDGSCGSVSCIHAAEHVGLGRYGDEIDPDGMTKCMRSLARVLAPGGSLYFAVPIGRQRVVFNAHRIASPRWVVETFEAAGLQCEDFSAVNDDGEWKSSPTMGAFETANYSLGCFEFRSPT